MNDGFMVFLLATHFSHFSLLTTGAQHEPIASANKCS
jgi:hypothetical protein